MLTQCLASFLPHDQHARAGLEGTNEGTAARRMPNSCSESGLDETWYRIPDSWRNVSCVSAAYTECNQETHETHETGPTRVQIGLTGQVACFGRRRPTGFHSMSRRLPFTSPSRPLRARQPHRVRSTTFGNAPLLANLTKLTGSVSGLTAIARGSRASRDIEAPLAGRRGSTPIVPLYKIEHAFAQRGLAAPVALLRRQRGCRPGHGSRSRRSPVSRGSRRLTSSARARRARPPDIYDEVQAASGPP
jgi:hypothetical protein